MISTVKHENVVVITVSDEKKNICFFESNATNESFLRLSFTVCACNKKKLRIQYNNQVLEDG